MRKLLKSLVLIIKMMLLKQKKFLSEFDNPYNMIISDKDGTLSIELGVYGVPESFLVYENKIIKKIIGPLNQNSLLEIKRKIR